MQVKTNKRKAAAISLSLLMGLSGGAYADMPDPYQNSGSNNIAYDVASKFYAGGIVGLTSFSDGTTTVNSQSVKLNTSSINVGAFAGYKLNSNFAFEANFLRLGKVSDKGGQGLSYSSSLYNLSADILASYPIISRYEYALSLYGKVGYGINFINTDYSGSGVTSVSSSTMKGAINAGVGINLDLRSNISARIGYTYYQAQYPLPDGQGHAANVFTLSLYYNFA